MALTFKKGAQAETLKFKDDFVAWTKHVADSASLEESELVFVGYGVEAPDKWDDYKGVDLKGKTMVVLINDPPLPDSKQFGGKACDLLWPVDVQFETGAKKGARHHHRARDGACRLSVRRDPSASGERFDLRDAGQEHVARLRRGLDLARPREAALHDGGRGLRRAQGAGGTREFKPVPLGVTACRSRTRFARWTHATSPPARRQRSEAEGRIRRLHRPLGSSRHRTLT